jgi:D-amino-acid oxidase
MGKTVAVIGAGISGLSTAYVLANQGFQVTVLAKAFSPNTTSNKAAAFWFPYHVRGDQRGIGWVATSYQYFKDLSVDPASGISFIKIVKGIKAGIVDDASWIEFMPPNTCTEVPREQLPDGYQQGFEAKVPLVETQLFLPYLQRVLTDKGVVFKEATITSLGTIATAYDVMVNCAGLGSIDLCNDNSIFPVRGQVLLVEPGFPDTIFLDNHTPTYIVPRQDATIIGGTYEEQVGVESTEPDTLQQLLTKASNVFPELQHKRIIGNWAGLRPFRATVRLEKEANTHIIHNYGHGGSGFTLSFGCAEAVLQLVEAIAQP